ncbi:hypothetical protein [Hymenobacter sp.]|uniref:hypothetical protein n=1 Tax=Hymenobacter sp. TaxID=1898978 RepID=UPI002ED98892
MPGIKRPKHKGGGVKQLLQSGRPAPNPIGEVVSGICRSGTPVGVVVRQGDYLSNDPKVTEGTM